MANTHGVYLSGVNLDRPVLATLTDASIDETSRIALDENLTASLKEQLANASTSAGYADLAPLVQAILSVNLVADKDISLQDFVRKEITLPTDPDARAAAEAAIDKLSTTTTVSDLLGLNSAVRANPILAGDVKQADLATLFKTSATFSSNAHLIDDFISRYTSFQGSIADFWNTLGQDPEYKAEVPELQLTLQLGTLTQDNPPFVSVLRASYPQMTSPRALTSLSETDWKQMIASQHIPVPDSISGDTPAEKASNYATRISGILKGAFPGTYFSQSLHETVGQAKDPVSQGVSTFLGNVPEFDILNTNLAQYTAQNNETVFKGIDPTVHTAVTNQLATWQRVARVTEDFSTANTLATAGFTSASQIAATPHASFIRQ